MSSKVPPDGKKSMRDFDYFASHAPVSPQQIAQQEGVPTEVAKEAESLVKLRNQARQTSIFSGLFFVVAAWFLWDYKDLASYAFREPGPPQILGDVTQLTPRDIPHNTYVQVQGITEHRGMMQKLVRGIGLDRREYWYFRLLGSQGVFIETPPDKETFGLTTEVLVEGRAVDPRKSSVHADLLRAYDYNFHPERRSELRVIQVGFVPGQGRTPFLVVILAFLGVATLNVFTLYRYVGARRRRSTTGLIR